MTPEGFAVAEGWHLLDEARRSGCEIGAVFLAARTQKLKERTQEVLIYQLPDALFDQLSTTEASQGVIALVRPPEWTLEQTMPPGGLTVILDGVQDPGNAGAIVRAAEAFAASGAIFLKGTASPFNPKTLRASAGSLFRLPFVHDADDSTCRMLLEQKGITLYSAMPTSSTELPSASLRSACAILIGSEGCGVRPEWTALATAVHIPTRSVESLNAATAAAVILYEAWRQRTLP